MMYSTFLATLASKPISLALSAVALALLSAVSTSLWAASGMTVRRWLRTDRDRAIIAGVLSLTLVYTAVELSGLPAVVGSLIR
jgi:threonine/homoserine/homoserine lactone efflux protein